MDQKQVDAARARLEDELKTVERQLSELGMDVDGGLHVDTDEGFADSAHATSERSQMLAEVDRVRVHHRDVLIALKKLDEGTYGTCENCGKEIPWERLEAIPSARLCVDCKQQAG
jgi:RNA polymerase-binding protein DksA